MFLLLGVWLLLVYDLWNLWKTIIQCSIKWRKIMCSKFDYKNDCATRKFKIKDNNLFKVGQRSRSRHDTNTKVLTLRQFTSNMNSLPSILHKRCSIRDFSKFWPWEFQARSQSWHFILEDIIQVKQEWIWPSHQQLRRPIPNNSHHRIIIAMILSKGSCISNMTYSEGIA